MGIGSKIAALLGLGHKDKRPDLQKDDIKAAVKSPEAVGEKRVMDRLRSMMANKFRTAPRLHGNGRLTANCEGQKSRQNWGRMSRRQAARNKTFNINWSSKALAGKPW